MRGDILKDEPSTKVELLGSGEDVAVLKTYRNTGVALLQTLLRKSRAAREYDNLAAARAAGLPCTEPLRWEEQRSLGFVRQSTLVTRYEPGCSPVREILRSGASRRERRWLAAQMGRLVARLHRAGILWCTLTPRNFLRQTRPEGNRLLVCDVPAAVHFGRSIHKARAADPDLYDAAFSASRRSDFTNHERRRLLLAYSEGDRAYLRQLEGRLADRKRWVHRLRKSLRKVVSMYLRPAWLTTGGARRNT